MTTLLPRDDDNNIIPAMRLIDGGAHVIAASATSNRNASPFAATTRVVSVYATGPVFVQFGKGSVTATTSDHYYPDGIYYDFALSGGFSGKSLHYTHIAVLAAADDCSVYISEKE